MAAVWGKLLKQAVPVVCTTNYFTVKIARNQAGDQGDTVSKNKCEQDSRHRDTVNNNNIV